MYSPVIPQSHFLIHKLLVLPNFFVYRFIKKREEKKNKRKESEVLFTFQYLAILKL